MLALVILLLAALFGLWLARVPIATGVIDRKLAESGVPARYNVGDLGFGRQRLTDVVIGDPRRPDLVADWIETVTDINAGGPHVVGVRAGRVRMRGRLVDGRLSLGEIDRLLPAPSGKPFALPAIDLVVEDGRMRLDTPAGVVGARLSGSGRLDGGFRGALALAGERLALGGCDARAPGAVLRVAIDRAAPVIAGPIRAAGIRCGDTAVALPRLAVNARLTPALDGWIGSARLASPQITAAGARFADVDVSTDFSGNAQRTSGTAKLTGGAFAVPKLVGRAIAFQGQWRLAPNRTILAGRVEAQGAALDPAARRMIADARDSASGTPLGPIARRIAQAAGTAAAQFDLSAELGVGVANGQLLATVQQASLRATNGANALFGDGTIRIGDPAGVRVAGAVAIAGGGLPSIRATVRQDRPGGMVTGQAILAPYAADGASLALTPVSFHLAPGGAAGLTTVATLSGPLGDGRVEALRLPLVARWNGAVLSINPACAPLQFAQLRVSGLVLRPARLSLCPIDGALVRIAGGRLGGGARLAATRLSGTLGSSPLSLAAAGAQLRLGQGGFTVDGLKARLGNPDRVTRLDIVRLDGKIGAGGLGGSFAGGAGQIGNVPLLLSDAAGRWTLRDGDLAATGDLAVADAAADPRFRPLAARAVSLRLADNRIEATGALTAPAKGVKVADVTLRHDLSSGRGSAHLGVPGITFGDGFQPEELTRLTFGVIADVKGSVTGTGDIAWSPDGVTSTGTFSTTNASLAAAFGPVTGISGTIRFTDLLNLESAPDQLATIASINPGVQVTDGRILYQTLPGNRIAVREGRWPFAGGTLTLEPTLLDFSAAQERRLTFRVAGMEAAQFLQQFDFDNIDATGTFDGVLPMVFDQTGGRIADGRLTVRPGGGTLAYVGELTEKDLGTWGNMAFQALKSLRYRNLDIVMNGPLAGEMITEVRFAGVSQGAGAKSNFLIRRLQQLPFVFNIRIKAPFRGLIDSAASFYDPKRLIERNLPALLEEQNKRAPSEAAPARSSTPPPIQPPASENRP